MQVFGDLVEIGAPRGVGQFRLESADGPGDSRDHRVDRHGTDLLEERVHELAHVLEVQRGVHSRLDGRWTRTGRPVEPDQGLGSTNISREQHTLWIIWHVALRKRSGRPSAFA